MVLRRASVGYASMAAQLNRSGVKVLLAVDQTSQVVEELGRLLPELRQVVIAHGSMRIDEFAGLTIRPRPHRILAVWGEWDAHAYASTQNPPVDCRILGSLRNAHYLRSHPIDQKRQTNSSIVFVSQFSGADEESDTPTSKRNQILQQMKVFVRRYCLERDVELVVALRPPVSAQHAPRQTEREIAHFQRVFSGTRLRFSDPQIPHESYLVSDYAEVTIGAPKGTLTESFARGNKVLMFCQHPETGDFYGFPILGPWIVHEPTFEQFAERLDTLRRMPRHEFAETWRREREYMVANAESDEPIKLVRQLLDRAIRGEPL
jgi:hypothetical protein